jgi:zinc protease
MNSTTSRRLTHVALAVAVVSTASLADRAFAQATDWKQIAKPPLPPFKADVPLRLALPNGMVIFLQEDKALPLIRGVAVIRGGSREEPADKIGLAAIFGQTWRTSGTALRNGDALDEFLESRGARVETGASSDSTTVSFDTLKDNFAEVFPVFTDLLRNPDFKDDKIVLAKNQWNASIARRNDDVAGIATREARKLGYGATSPLARQAEYATIAAVTKDDLIAWHKANVHPNNIIVSVTGDFDAKAMEAELRKAFGTWAKGPAFPRQKFTAPDPKPGVYFVQRDDVNQSQIRLLHAGTTRMNPDYYAITVMNEVFGGGFSARLFSNIRSKKGLAYSVGGGVGAGLDTPSLFQLSMGTKSSTTAAAIDALYEEIDNLKKVPPTDAEIKGAKDAILNSFIFRFDTKRKMAIERVNNEFYGLPADLLDQFVPGIQKVTAADVKRAIDTYVHRDKVAVLVVGKSQDFDRPLSSFGPVTALDITIPPRPGAPAK